MKLLQKLFVAATLLICLAMAVSDISVDDAARYNSGYSK